MSYPGGSNQEDDARRGAAVHPPVLPLSLKPVDPELLRSRLVSAGPGVLQRDPEALVYSPHTFIPPKLHSSPKPMRQELLVRRKRKYFTAHHYHLCLFSCNNYIVLYFSRP